MSEPKIWLRTLYVRLLKCVAVPPDEPLSWLLFTPWTKGAGAPNPAPFSLALIARPRVQPCGGLQGEPWL
jgi:hypothetical protein